MIHIAYASSGASRQLYMQCIVAGSGACRQRIDMHRETALVLVLIAAVFQRGLATRKVDSNSVTKNSNSLAKKINTKATNYSLQHLFLRKLATRIQVVGTQRLICHIRWIL